MPLSLNAIKLSFSPQNKKRPLYLLILVFSLLLSVQSWPTHADVACPDIVEYGGESIDYWFYDRNTGEPYSDGQIVPVGTRLKLDILATAYGKCEKFYPMDNVCHLTHSNSRTVNHTQAYVTIESPGSLNGVYSVGKVFGRHPETGTTAYYQVLDSRDDTMTSGTIGMLTASTYPGSYRFSIQEIINTTVCNILPASLTKYFTIYTHDFSNEKNLGSSCASAGTPCNVATGNKYQPEVDYLDPLSTLTFVRHYNSQLALIDFGLGFGWTSSFHKRLEIYTNSTVIRARRFDGRIERFSLIDLTWQGDPENTLALVENAAGYTLRLQDDTEERYDLTGRIVSETDSNGKTLTYSYNADSRLGGVVDDYGRTVSLTYNSDGHLDTVLKPSGETVRYVYDTNRNLQRVEYSPDNVSRTYHYEDPRTIGYFKHYLTGITDERGILYATFEYNDQNKVSASYHAGNANRVDIAYNTDGTRVVTNSIASP